MPGKVTAPTFGLSPQSRDILGLRAGIVGLGFIGEVHARAVRYSGATLAAVADSTAERSASAATRLGAERGSSASELIESDDIDVVHICTPNHLHAELAAAAIAAGKHVVCEKPLATSADDARALQSAAARRGVVAAVPFVYRYYPMVRDARARVAAGETGAVRLIHGSYLQDWLSNPDDHNWRVDSTLGGPSRTFADIGVHWCDLVEFTSGHRITRLAAQTLTAFPHRRTQAGSREVATEDAAALLFETDQGAIGSVVASQITPGRKNRLWFSLDGADSSLAFDQEIPESLWIGQQSANQVVVRGSARMEPSAARYSVLPAGHPQGYQDCFNAFVRDVHYSIAGETVDGLPTFADGHRAAEITEAVIEAARTGAWVVVPS